MFHAGDLVANGYRPCEVLDRLRELGWEGVCGNTDEMLWKPEKLAVLAITNPGRQNLRKVLFEITGPATRERLGPERVAWLRGLPVILRVDDIAIVHASPRSLWQAPLATGTDTELVTTYEELAAKKVVYGHIHSPFARVLGGFTAANTGAASLSYDGDPRACYALIEDGKVTHRRVEYDIEREAKGLLKSGYPCAGWLAGILTSGRYTDPPTAR